MRAVQWRRPGPAAEVLELVELPDYEPGPGRARCASASRPPASTRMT
jgi:NADPH:quinone reductase-like Zn-dependent oxidoreductase